MKDWFCPFQFDKHFADESASCTYRSKELEDGAILTNNYGAVGAWYHDEEIDLRPTACFYWREVNLFACNAPCDEHCEIKHRFMLAIEKCKVACRELLYKQDFWRYSLCAKEVVRHGKQTAYYNEAQKIMPIPIECARYVTLVTFCKILNQIVFRDAMIREFGSWERYLQWLTKQR